MKEFIEYLLKEFVSKPEEIVVTETVDPETTFKNYQIKVAQEDIGLVIGKEGRTIKSLRNLTRAKAIKDGVRMNLELIEVDRPAETTEPEVKE
jgi:predicted RNA-binding protein YlqC (UPF0109 family)